MVSSSALDKNPRPLECKCSALGEEEDEEEDEEEEEDEDEEEEEEDRGQRTRWRDEIRAFAGAEWSTLISNREVENFRKGLVFKMIIMTCTQGQF